MKDDTIGGDLIRGHIDAMILRVLLDGDSYGYEIIKAINTKSGGEYELKEPSLYTSLKRLEAGQMIASYWGDESQGGRRKYYKITESGRQHYSLSLSRWRAARAVIDLLIDGGADNE